VPARADAESYDVVVVGGGATGCATAYYLSRTGARVLLLERHQLNTEASGRNAGSLHGQIQHEPYRELGEEWARSWLPALRFLADSLELWDGLSAELGVDLEVRRKGGLLVADAPEQLDWIERKVALENEAGVPSRVLDARELRTLAPWATSRLVGAELCPIEGKANPLLAGPTFARRAAGLGAEVRTGTAVEAIEPGAGEHLVRFTGGSARAPRVVVATGDAMPWFGDQLGVPLPITSEAIQANVTERVAPLVEHLVYYAGGRLTFKQSASGTLLIGGGWPARRDALGQWVLDSDSLRANLATAMTLFPQLADVRLVRTWVGVGNGTPDHRPVLGEAPGHPGVFLGLYPYMGFTASPLMGRTLAALALGEDPGRDLAPFAPGRFAAASV
jgi:sarcosine oxidase, subunit beta